MKHAHILFYSFLSWIIANELGSKKLLAVEPYDATKRSEDIVQDVARKDKELREMKSNGKLWLNFVSDSASVYVEARRLLRQVCLHYLFKIRAMVPKLFRLLEFQKNFKTLATLAKRLLNNLSTW